MDSGFTFIDVGAAASVGGEVVPLGAEAVEAPGSVHALMHAEAPGLPQRKQAALIYVCADIVVPARDCEPHVTGAARGTQKVRAVRGANRGGRRCGG